MPYTERKGAFIVLFLLSKGPPPSRIEALPPYLGAPKPPLGKAHPEEPPAYAQQQPNNKSGRKGKERRGPLLKNKGPSSSHSVGLPLGGP